MAAVDYVIRVQFECLERNKQKDDQVAPGLRTSKYCPDSHPYVRAGASTFDALVARRQHLSDVPVQGHQQQRLIVPAIPKRDTLLVCNGDVRSVSPASHSGPT